MQELRRKSRAFIRSIGPFISKENPEKVIVGRRATVIKVEEDSDLYNKLLNLSFKPEPSSDQSIEEIDQQLEWFLKLGPEQVAADTQPNDTVLDNSERPSGGQSSPKEDH